ncbi:MAG: EF-hand domain-containing protein [Pirellulaceae bacterium]|nr:EF-hand domain-containing protein [Pirellulaceae bacterium]
MRKMLILGVSAAALGLSATAAVAQPPGPPPEMLDAIFERLDTNGDGVLDEQEIFALVRQRITRADTNKDSNIDKHELAEGMELFRALVGRGGPGMGGDGPRRGPGGQFGPPDGFRPDGDRPGRPEGFGPGRRPGPPPGPPAGPPRGPRPDGPPGRGPDGEDRGPRPERIMQMFDRWDEDGDGKVAIDDLPGPLQERLRALDKNNDGQIDKKELKEFRPPRDPENADKPRDRRSDDAPPGPKKPKRPKADSDAEV